METFSFGSYYAGRSFVHRLDPRTKLLAGFGFLFIALASHSFPALAVLAIGIGISYAMAHIPAHYAARCFWCSLRSWPSSRSLPSKAAAPFSTSALLKSAKAASIPAALSHAACS